MLSKLTYYGYDSDNFRELIKLYCILKGRVLEETVSYSVFVKAWYNKNTYAVFKSNGVIIDTKKPAVQNILGTSVRNTWLISCIINNI